ncbi:hypothetical protein B0H16DRAFT_1461485 [Mycena metata]|uniref:Uncharacterized protein n=1 Tax=Mycena metata TaxID=1033252 RepID=A0AAD7N7V4_9AGAR|nr:hypothetical protein B0H16DRAFT_1461485 [Mycena metata]
MYTWRRWIMSLRTRNLVHYESRAERNHKVSPRLRSLQSLKPITAQVQLSATYTGILSICGRRTEMPDRCCNSIGFHVSRASSMGLNIGKIVPGKIVPENIRGNTALIRR